MPHTLGLEVQTLTNNKQILITENGYREVILYKFCIQNFLIGAIIICQEFYIIRL